MYMYYHVQFNATASHLIYSYMDLKMAYNLILHIPKLIAQTLRFARYEIYSIYNEIINLKVTQGL